MQKLQLHWRIPDIHYLPHPPRSVSLQAVLSRPVVFVCINSVRWWNVAEWISSQSPCYLKAEVPDLPQLSNRSHSDDELLSFDSLTLHGSLEGGYLTKISFFVHITLLYWFQERSTSQCWLSIKCQGVIFQLPSAETRNFQPYEDQ